MRYKYEGMKRGRAVKGAIEAPTESVARVKLARKGIQVTSIKEDLGKVPAKSVLANKKVKTKSVIEFAQTLKDLLESGISVSESIKIARNTIQDKTIRYILYYVEEDVGNGVPFSVALGRYKGLGEDFLSLLQAGEQSGDLEGVLGTAIDMLVTREQTMKKVKKALSNPAFTIGAGVVITIGMMVFVMPRFKELFKSFNISLPAITRIYIDIGDFIISKWWLIVLIIFGLGIFHYFGGISLLVPKSTIDKVKLNIPLIGTLEKVTSQWIIAEQLKQMLKAGVSLSDALKDVQKMVPNAAYREALREIQKDVYSGMNLDQAFTKHIELFDVTFIFPIRSATQTGAIDVAFERIAKFYKSKLDTTLEKLTGILPHIALIITSMLVLSMMLAIYMPMLSLMSNINM